MYWFIIPARKGSKEFPFKNRKLFKYTANMIPSSFKNQVIVSSDDEKILEMSKDYNFKTLKRKKGLSTDTANTRDVLINAVEEFKIPEEDFVILLYLVYPDRKWNDIERGIAFIEEKKASALLCRKEIELTPYLMMFEEENNKATKVINHDLSRRQDYKKCFSLSHYVAIFKSKELYSLDTNLWNRDTIFLSIDSWVDIDTRENLEDFLGNNEASK
jgi:CMP-N,N'-diacetyllegionaminic acid synthase